MNSILVTMTIQVLWLPEFAREPPWTQLSNIRTKLEWLSLRKISQVTATLCFFCISLERQSMLLSLYKFSALFLSVELQGLDTMDGCITFSIRKSCLLLLLAFCCILRCCANAAGEKQRPPIKSAVVVGTVYCDTCFLQKLSKSGHFIPGKLITLP